MDLGPNCLTISSRSAEKQVDEIYGFVSSENVKMMNMCTRKGFVGQPAEEGVSKIVLKLS